ncbi:hypothetical protein L0337_09025 [candidate division KSB1 bacterium]|nr:hypothetical protein [candidate division KSB1 bacterium]
MLAMVQGVDHLPGNALLRRAFVFTDPEVFDVFTFSLMIALLTVSTQAIKAALANPVEALRYE